MCSALVASPPEVTGLSFPGSQGWVNNVYERLDVYERLEGASVSGSRLRCSNELSRLAMKFSIFIGR